MESRTRRGFLVPADVSGFTAFLTSSELDHAQDIIGELLDLIVRRLIPRSNSPKWKAMRSMCMQR